MKLSTVQIEAICRRYLVGESTVELGRSFDVSHTWIWMLLKRFGVHVRSISEARVKTLQDQETRRRIQDSHRTPESRRRTSEARQRYFQDPESRRYHREIHRTPEARQKTSESVRSSPKAQAQRERLRHLARPNGSERTLYGWLDESRVQYIKEHKIRPYFADVFVPSLNLAIECDGYHHQSQKRITKDHIRNVFFNSRGIETIRLSSRSIDNGTNKAAIMTILRPQ
jgi:very-short-patch-repair endonuclease